MANIIMSITKYINILLIGIYVIISFNALKKTTKNKKRTYYTIQNWLMYMFLVFSFIVIYLETKQDKIIIFCGLQLIYFILAIRLFRLFYPKVNRMLLNNMSFLMSIGFVMLTRISYTKAVKQFVFCFVATVVSFFLPWLFGKTKTLRNFYFAYGIIGLLMLVAVYIIGNESYGAMLSLDLGFVSIQPSEFVKVSYVIFISGILHRNKSFKTVVLSAILAAMHVLVLVISTDLGSALIYFIAYIFMIYVSTGKSRYLFAGLLSACVAAVIAYMLFSHIQVRVAAWMDPWSIIEGKGYQIAQSLFAIGTGGWFGMGLYNGNPSYIPVVEQDFMYSAISEELGGFFALFLLFVYFNLFIVLIRVAFRCRDEFYKLTVFGLAIVMGFQVFLTVGGAIKLIPSTGVTLPLVSYGGSSVVSTIMMFGIIQGIYINQSREDNSDGK